MCIGARVGSDISLYSVPPRTPKWTWQMFMPLRGLLLLISALAIFAAPTTALASARAALSSAPRLALALMSSSRVRIPMTLSLAFMSLQGLDAVASPST